MDYRLPEETPGFTVSNHAMDRLRERVELTRDWSPDLIRRALFALLGQWQRVRLDGIYFISLMTIKLRVVMKNGNVVTVMNEAEYRAPRIPEPRSTEGQQEKVKAYRRQVSREKARRRARILQENDS